MWPSHGVNLWPARILGQSVKTLQPRTRTTVLQTFNHNVTGAKGIPENSVIEVKPRIQYDRLHVITTKMKHVFIKHWLQIAIIWSGFPDVFARCYGLESWSCSVRWSCIIFAGYPE